VTGEPLDPGGATSALIKRGPFLAAGTAATVAAGAGAAPAATAAYGKPHAPIVSETDPSIVVFRPLLESAGRLINSYAAVPKDAPPAAPGVVVAMHVWGVDAQIRDTVRRFAKAGYITIAPDLYSDFGPPSGDGVSDIDIFRPLAKQLVPETMKSDLSSGAAWVRSRLPAAASSKAKVGIIGFCMGGHIALNQTIVAPAVFDAVSSLYGAVAGLDPAGVRCAAIGSYGAGDTSIPVDGLKTFFSALVPAHDLKIYSGAGHAFFDDTRASYAAPAASDAWQRTLAWFGKYLAA
jgi:carboxymethylenebutenolidase